MAKPLKGIRVLDMGTFITGPAAAMLLADLGAEVIKVEQPGTGDPFRAFDGDLYSPHFQTYNRNKKSIELNTKEPADLAKFDALVATADVFIQNFRPGVAERLKVDAARLQAINPRLVYADISGFGQEGPHKDRPVGEGQEWPNRSKAFACSTWALSSRARARRCCWRTSGPR